MPAANVRRRGMVSPEPPPADVLRRKSGISRSPGPGARGSSGSRISPLFTRWKKRSMKPFSVFGRRSRRDLIARRASSQAIGLEQLESRVNLKGRTVNGTFATV
jgi:hypothetical protein